MSDQSVGTLVSKFGKICTRLCSAIFLITIVILFRLFVAELCVVPSDSMMPAVCTGDYVVYEKYTYGGSTPRRLADIPLVNAFTWVASWRACDSHRHWQHRRLPGLRQPRVGDVAVFYNPDIPDMLLVKRIAQVIEQGTVVPLDSAHIAMATALAAHDGFTLQPHHTTYTTQQAFYYMLGDNTHNSTDSRYFGYIPQSELVGKMGRVLWSWDSEATGLDKMRWGRILHRIR